MPNIFRFLMLFICSFPLFAKIPNKLCINAQGEQYTAGDGSKTNPFMICNFKQFKHFAEDAKRSTLFFKLGVDINFKNRIFPLVGTYNEPFKGGFDGSGYTFSSIMLPLKTDGYIAPFPHVQNGEIENLSINGITLAEFSAHHVGGLVALAEHSHIVNVHVNGLNIKASDSSGGVVGELIDSLVYNSSSKGTLMQQFGTKSIGGLIGVATRADIFSCTSHVNLVNKETSSTGDVSKIGGLIGFAADSRIREVYSDGNIDYSTVLTVPEQVKSVGGLIGYISNSYLSSAYYAGNISVDNTPSDKGGAVGTSLTSKPSYSHAVFWDKKVSGIKKSAIGKGVSTKQLKTKAFWLDNGFDTRFWFLQKNNYPKLFVADV